MAVHAIILAGGGGTRLWPLSRTNRPKQFLELFSDKTLLQEAINRIGPIVDSVNISPSADLIGNVRALFPVMRLIVQPSRRETGAAIALCASRFDPEDTLIFMPSDHYIAPDHLFHKTIRSALDAVDDSIVLVGIEPSYPATGYGYFEPGDGWSVKSFKEKPDAHTAKEYIGKGYLWNAGIFIAKTKTLLNAFKEHAPEFYDAAMEGITDEVYSSLPKISFDIAILQAAHNIRYVKGNFVWNDVGSFDTMSDIIRGKNSVLSGTLTEINSRNNVVASRKAVALIDCEGMVIIDTPDALLVCPKSSVQKVKELVEGLDENLK